MTTATSGANPKPAEEVPTATEVVQRLSGNVTPKFGWLSGHPFYGVADPAFVSEFEAVVDRLAPS
jgi:hypothetical protein